MPQKKDWENVVLPYAEDHGCTTIGAIGTCWGSYMVVRMSSHPLISAGVSMYPSHSTVIKVMKENEKDILAQIQVILIFKMPVKKTIICSNNQRPGDKKVKRGQLL